MEPLKAGDIVTIKAEVVASPAPPGNGYDLIVKVLDANGGPAKGPTVNLASALVVKS